MSYKGARPHKIQTRMSDYEIEELDGLVADLKGVAPLIAPDRSQLIRYAIHALHPFVNSMVQNHKQSIADEKAFKKQLKIE